LLSRATIPHSTRLVETNPLSSFSFQTYHYEYQLGNELVSYKTKDLAQANKIDLYHILLAIVQVLLFRHTGQSNILVASPLTTKSSANRSNTSNSLVLFQTHLFGHLSFQALLDQITHAAQVAIASQNQAWEQFAEPRLWQQEDVQIPLHIVFAVESECTYLPVVQKVGTVWKHKLIEQTTQSVDMPPDLILVVTQIDSGFSICVEFNPDLFEAMMIQRMMEQLQPVLETVVVNPKQPIAKLPVISETEWRQLLVGLNNTVTDYARDRCIHEWFEEQAQQTPDAIAVVFGHEQLTYQQLNQRANQLAHHLQALGVEPETLVGICIERSLLMVVALLGVLKAGGAYVPLDPSYPSDRLTYMLADAQVYLLLTTARLLETSSTIAHVAQGCSIVAIDRDWDTISQVSNHNPVSPVKPDNLAYVLYTSGSTGKPKGVMMEHLALVNLIDWHLHHRITGAKTLQFAPLSFDISFHEIFSTWCSGGTLVLISDEQRRNPEALVNVILEYGIEKLYLPFAALQQLAKVATRRPLQTRLREVMTAGEQLQILPNIAQFFQQISCTLHNHYGATECQDVTTFTLPPDVNDWVTLPPIGRPIHNTQVYILDEWHQLVPTGVAGDLYIGGKGIARGYLNRLDLTQERFITNPFGSGYLYKTGDLARYLPDGNLQHLGRADRQVKVRGFRIELGEIEGLLAKHPMVRENAVILREDVPGHKRLVAYVVSSQDIMVSHELEVIVHGYLRDCLPDYMVPAALVLLDRMPLTPSGKLDRQSLPVPTRSLSVLTTGLLLPQTETEKQITRVWQNVLQLDEVSVNHNFFELGGTSLLLLEVYEKLTDIFGDCLTTITTLFQYPTIQTLAQHLSQNTAESKVTNQGLFFGNRCFTAAQQQKKLRQAHRARQK
jgi:amino acid adenylation domain-containing protein